MIQTIFFFLSLSQASLAQTEFAEKLCPDNPEIKSACKQYIQVKIKSLESQTHDEASEMGALTLASGDCLQDIMGDEQSLRLIRSISHSFIANESLRDEVVRVDNLTGGASFKTPRNRKKRSTCLSPNGPHKTIEELKKLAVKEYLSRPMAVSYYKRPSSNKHTKPKMTAACYMYIGQKVSYCEDLIYEKGNYRIDFIKFNCDKKAKKNGVSSRYINNVTCSEKNAISACKALPGVDKISTTFYNTDDNNYFQQRRQNCQSLKDSHKWLEF